MKALITAGTTAAAFAVERLLGAGTTVIFGDSPGFPVPSLPVAKFILLPDAGSVSFIHEFLQLCLDHQVTQVLPLRRGEISGLSTARQLFSEFGITVASGNGRYLPAQPVSGSEMVILLENKIIGSTSKEGGKHLPAENGIYCFSKENGYSIYSAD